MVARTMYKCSECDSQEFIQTVTQVETVKTNENGEPTQIDKNGEVDVHYVECVGCGKVMKDEN